MGVDKFSARDQSKPSFRNRPEFQERFHWYPERISVMSSAGNTGIVIKTEFFIENGLWGFSDPIVHGRLHLPWIPSE